MHIRQIQNPAPPPPKPKRVAGYARVSSGKDAMLHSLSAQVSYYSDLIAKHPEWDYAGVFADEAIEIFKTHDMRDYLFGECTYHYQIADASGKTCVIEYIDGEVTVLYPEKNKNNKVDYMAASNFYLTEGR